MSLRLLSFDPDLVQTIRPWDSPPDSGHYSRGITSTQGAIFSIYIKYFAVTEWRFLLNLSYGAAAVIVPPLSPGPGPSSMR